MKEIKELGIKLTDDIERCKYSRTVERNPQTLFKQFKDNLTSFVRKYARIAIPKLDKKIANEEKRLKTALNKEGVNTEEKQMIAALIEEKIKELELQRHTKIRDNIGARARLDETIGKYWININKERRPRDTILALKKPDTNPPKYEKRSSAMAEIAWDYHNGLQQEGVNPDADADNQVEDVLDNLTKKVTPSKKTKLAENIKQSEVRQAIQALPNGKAPRIDGIPHELWKALAERHNIEKKNKNPEVFDIVATLTKVYNDI